MDNPSPQDLGFDADLARDLLAWGDAYDAIFPEDDPGSAAFSSPSAEDAFNNTGSSLVRRVKQAVGDRYEVTSWDRRDQAWLRVPGDGRRCKGLAGPSPGAGLARRARRERWAT